MACLVRLLPPFRPFLNVAGTRHGFGTLAPVLLSKQARDTSIHGLHTGRGAHNVRRWAEVRAKREGGNKGARNLGPSSNFIVCWVEHVCRYTGLDMPARGKHLLGASSSWSKRLAEEYG